jgi:hypothetical protein
VSLQDIIDYNPNIFKDMKGIRFELFPETPKDIRDKIGELLDDFNDKNFVLHG